MLKNAIVYRLPDGLRLKDDQVVENLAKRPESHQLTSIGFAPHPVLKVIACAIGDKRDSTVLTILKWEKKIDSKAINAEVSSLAKALNRKVEKAELRAIRENVIAKVLPTILPSPKYIQFYYRCFDNVLIIDSASEKEAEDVISFIRKVIGSLKCIPIAQNVDPIPLPDMTYRLNHSMVGGHRDILNGKFQIGGKLKLSELKQSITYKDIEFTDCGVTEEIQEWIDGGFSVDEIQLILPNQCSFIFKDHHILKSIKYDGNLLSGTDPENDAIADCKAEMFLKLSAILAVYTILNSEFNYRHGNS